MDVWQWVSNLQNDLVEAGQAHNARLIEDLTSYCCDKDIAKVDALLPEAKALAKTLDNPWLSIFIGHWEMRHRLGNKNEGETIIADAVELFEFANRGDNQECPQSVCVTQDLAACYSLVDGVGWAPERIAVSEETMARIDPSWNCYKCLSCEKALALLDQDKPEEALEFLNETIEKVVKVDDDEGSGIFETVNDVLLKLGRYDEVIARLDGQDSEQARYDVWKNVAQPKAIQKAYALARLGKADEALDVLPTLRDINLGDMFEWLEAIYPVLLESEEENVWQLGSSLFDGLKYISSNGAHRQVIDMADMNVRLAVKRGARWSAQQQLDLARGHLDKLRIDAGATQKLDTLQALIDAMPKTSLPVPADKLIEWLNPKADEAVNDEESAIDKVEEPSTLDTDLPEAPAIRNPEQEVEWLLSALATYPDDMPICITSARALQACGSVEDGIEVLWAFIERNLPKMRAEAKDDNTSNVSDSDSDSDSNPDSKTSETADNVYAVKFELLDLLLNAGDSEGIKKLSSTFADAGDHVFANWCLVQLSYQQFDWDNVETYTQALLQLEPDAHNARSILAQSLLNRQQFAQAAIEYKKLIDALPDNTNYHWNYLTAVTAAQDWHAMRMMANTLEMDMAVNDEPPAEDWGWVIIRYNEQGNIVDYYAKRTGPVSAQILENAPPNKPQHVDDHIVFDAQVLIPPPEDEEERKHFIPTFAYLTTLNTGDYKESIFIDGAHPGDEAIDTLREELEKKDWKLWVYSGNSYELTDTENEDESLAGVMLFLAVPNAVSAKQVNEVLTTHTKDWAHRMCWLRLAEEAGVDTAPHKEVIERYGL